MAPPVKKRLGELLIEADVIDEHQLRSALGHQRQWGGKLGQALVDLKLATEPQIVEALAKTLGFPIVSLAAVERAVVEPALKLLPAEVARRHNVLPIACETGSITLAMSDPTNVRVADEVSFRTGRRVKIALAGDREVARAVARLYFPEQERDARALELPPSVPLSRAYDERPDQAQQVYYRTTAPGSREAALRDALDRMVVAGDEVPGGLRSARLAAAMAKALLRRGLLTEAELIAELTTARK
jgi:hypothetical protein